MEYTPSKLFTNFQDKQYCLNEIKNHVNMLEKTNLDNEKFLWSSSYEDGSCENKIIGNSEPIKTILTSQSTNTNNGIRRFYDQIIYDSEKKFGGSTTLIQTFIINLSKEFIKRDIKPNDTITLSYLKLFFETFVPVYFSRFSLPNDSKTFSKAVYQLTDIYPQELIEAALKAILMAGNGGNIIVKQNIYSNEYEIKNNIDGYQFKTFEKSKMFVGLQKTKNDKAISFLNPKLLLINGAIEEVSEIEDILEQSANTKQPIIVIANRIGEEIFETFKLNFDKDLLECFAIESKNDFTSLNTVNDIGVIANSIPITPLTMESEFILAKWDELPCVDEIIFFKDGNVTIRNQNTQFNVRKHIQGISKKRQELTEEEYEIKEANLTARIKNLTSSPVVLYAPYTTITEGETKKIQIDSILRIYKSIITFGLIDCSNLDINSAIQEFKEKNNLDDFEKYEWIFNEILNVISNKKIPYLYLVGAIRFAATQILPIFNISGIVLQEESHL